MEWTILNHPEDASFYFSIISNHCVCDKCKWLHKEEYGPVFCGNAKICISYDFDDFELKD